MRVNGTTTNNSVNTATIGMGQATGLNISRGIYPHISYVNKFGEDPAMGTGGGDVWELKLNDGRIGWYEDDAETPVTERDPHSSILSRGLLWLLSLLPIEQQL